MEVHTYEAACMAADGAHSDTHRTLPWCKERERRREGEVLKACQEAEKRRE